MKDLFITFLGLSICHAEVLYDSSAPDPDPTSQGWTASEVVAGTDSDSDGLIDSLGNAGPVSLEPGSPVAWQIRDQLEDDSSNIPTYSLNLTNDRMAELYEDGFIMSFQLRARSSHNVTFLNAPWSGFFSLEFPASLFPGGSNRRIGFAIGLTTPVTATVTNEAAPATRVSLGSGSANLFHTVTIVKAPRTSQYRWSVNDQVGGTLNIGDGVPSPGSDRVTFTSGTSAGINGTIDLLNCTLEAFPIHVEVDSAHPSPDGSSWEKAFPDLQSALASATTGDQIWVAEGTYYPDITGSSDTNLRTSTFHLKEGVDLYGGFGGTESLLSQRDFTAHRTILSGDLDQDDEPDFANRSDNAYNVVSGESGLTGDTILDGFTITAGHADGGSFPHNEGGGLRLNEASPTVKNCSIQDNHASFGGGSFFRSSSLTLANCTFQRNRSDSSGGAIYCSGKSLSKLANCHFFNNRAGASGGGVFNTNSSPSFSDCSFQGNQSTSAGGGVHNRELSSSAFANCSFRDNQAGLGGGIYQTHSSSTLTNCSFRGNVAESFGGGVYHNSSSSTLTNCGFQGNWALSAGGGMCNAASSPVLANCSLQGNRATVGGAIYNLAASFPALVNCIVWNNADQHSTLSPGASVLDFESTPETSYDHCLIQNLDLSGIGLNSFDGTDPANAPLFVNEVDPLTAPNSSGGDLRLLTRSPALEVGDNSANSSATDLAGNPRIVGRIDLGAHEGNIDATFTLLHPGLVPGGDENQNGFPNFLEYAYGSDPTATHDPSLYPAINGTRLTFRIRNNAADVSYFLQKSRTLEAGSWQDMSGDTEYTLDHEQTLGGQSIRTLNLHPSQNSGRKLFFRLRLPSER